MGPVFAYINILRRLCYCAFMHAHFSITKICDARPAVTFLAAEHHRPSISTKLYCLVTEAGVRERLDYGRTRQRSGWELISRPVDCDSVALCTTQSSNAYVPAKCRRPRCTPARMTWESGNEKPESTVSWCVSTFVRCSSAVRLLQRHDKQEEEVRSIARELIPFDIWAGDGYT